MLKTLAALWTAGTAAPPTIPSELGASARGLPTLTKAPCEGCGACDPVCPTAAIQRNDRALVLDRGLCIACGECVAACPSGTLVTDRRTRVAVRTRSALIMRNDGHPVEEARLPALSSEADPLPDGFLHRSLHVREVSTGDNATDLEVAATGNPIFDVGRFGVHYVASPRHADALLVTGPVGRAMQEPLRRCYDAMSSPRVVIAVGAAAISGALHRDGYAEANGVESHLPVSVYVPGNPPHPWSIVHGLLLAMGRDVPATE